MVLEPLLTFGLFAANEMDKISQPFRMAFTWKRSVFTILNYLA
jgi:hypothetical protein